MHSGSKPVNVERSDDRLLTVVEAARFLNITPGGLYHMISSPDSRIPAIRISARCVRFSRNALLKWLDEMTQSAE